MSQPNPSKKWLYAIGFVMFVVLFTVILYALLTGLKNELQQQPETLSDSNAITLRRLHPNCVVDLQLKIHHIIDLKDSNNTVPLITPVGNGKYKLTFQQVSNLTKIKCPPGDKQEFHYE